MNLSHRELLVGKNDGFLWNSASADAVLPTVLLEVLELVVVGADWEFCLFKNNNNVSSIR